MSRLREDYGNARFASDGELESAGFFNPEGFVFARGLKLHPAKRQEFAHNGGKMWVENLEGAGPLNLHECQDRGLLFLGKKNSQEHVMVMAQTEAGKTTGVIIPNCVTHPGSLVAIDPKGELAALTALYRKIRFQQDIHVIDPAGVKDFPSSSVDIVSCIPKDNPLPMCSAIAGILDPPARGEAPYWRDESVWFMSAFLGFIATDPSLSDGERKIGLLRQYICYQDEALQRLADKMLESDFPFIRNAGGSLKDLTAGDAQGQAKGVFGKMRNATTFLEVDALRAALEDGQCDLRRVKRDRMSVYIVLSTGYLRSYPTFPRLILELLLKIFEDDKTETDISPLLLVDEFGNLGKMDVLVKGLTIARSFGLRIVLVLQDIGQAKDLYGEHAFITLMSNCALKVWLRPGAKETVEYLSAELGQTTFNTITQTERPYRQSTASKIGDLFYNIIADEPGQRLWNEVKQTREEAKQIAWRFNPGRWQTQTQGHRGPLMSPDQLNALPEDVVIITRSGGRPVFARRLKSYDDPEFSHIYDDRYRYKPAQRERIMARAKPVKTSSQSKPKPKSKPKSPFKKIKFRVPDKKDLGF